MTCWNPLASCRTVSLLAGLLAAALTSFVAAPAARAETLQLAAAAFTPRGTAIQGEVGAGMLLNATGKYYAAVPFPVGGMRVCRFSLLYRDNDPDAGINITAKLLRKGNNVGGTAFNPPVVMAQVASTGAVDTMRSASTAAITNPAIWPAIAFYYVEVEIPAMTLEVVGVQIEHKASCQ